MRLIFISAASLISKIIVFAHCKYAYIRRLITSAKSYAGGVLGSFFVNANGSRNFIGQLAL